jgi:hypothetical protein
LFRRTDRLGVLQDSIFSPIDYRLLDAIDLAHYIDYENELEQESDSSNYSGDESMSFDAYYSSSQPLSSRFGRRLLVEIGAKPSIVSHFVDHASKKKVKFLCDVWI